VPEFFSASRVSLRLADRGRSLSCASLEAGLVGLSADANAAAVFGNILGGQVLAAWTTTPIAATSPFSSIAITIMTKKIAIIAGSFIVLLGIGTYVVVHEGGKSKNAPSPTSSAQRVTEQTSSGRAGADDSRNFKKSTRTSPENKWGDLVDRYSESRVNFAHHVGSELGGSISDMAALYALMSPKALDEFVREGLKELQLTPEQQKEVAKFAMNWELENYNKMVESINNDPRDLMEALLAGDAYTRGEISKEEYDSRAGKVGNLLAFQRAFENKDDGNEGGGGVRFSLKTYSAGDPGFGKGINSLLTPQQLEIAGGRWKEDGDQVEKQEPTEAAPLENIDRSIAATRKMLKSMTAMLESAQDRPEKFNGK
jgi:hypothetical protein